jgi:hypothetical protein
MSALYDYYWRIQEEDERLQKYLDEKVLVHLVQRYQGHHYVVVAHRDFLHLSSKTYLNSLHPQFLTMH